MHTLTTMKQNPMIFNMYIYLCFFSGGDTERRDSFLTLETADHKSQLQTKFTVEDTLFFVKLQHFYKVTQNMHLNINSLYNYLYVLP